MLGLILGIGSVSIMLGMKDLILGVKHCIIMPIRFWPNTA